MKKHPISRVFFHLWRASAAVWDVEDAVPYKWCICRGCIIVGQPMAGPRRATGDRRSPPLPSEHILPAAMAEQEVLNGLDIVQIDVKVCDIDYLSGLIVEAGKIHKLREI